MLVLALAALVVPPPTAEARAAAPVDGRIVAVTSSCTRYDEVNEPHFLDPDGSDRVDWSGPGNSGMSWSPDGKDVAYITGRPDGQYVVIDDVADGPDTDPRTVTLASAGAWCGQDAPTWSPDGTRLAYVLITGDPYSMSSSDAPTADVHVVNADGTGDHLVAAGAGDPSWGPGGRIAFTHGGALHTVRPDGTGDKVVVPSGAWQPRWTAAGHLAFETSGGITIANADGSHRHRVVSATMNQQPFDVAPDGTAVAYASTAGLKVKDLATGSTRTIADLKCSACVFGASLLSIDWGSAPTIKHPCGGRPDSTILGTPGPDVIRGTAGPDVISAYGGNDVVRGLGGNDVICGGTGKDKLYGGAGSDLLRARDGRKDAVLDCGTGRDQAPAYDKGLDPKPLSCG
ncbi:hypothetical protein GCM10027076_11730 [Nocardioides montaniterrae]